jgi:tRNA threonylcarbamoyl adenosine modification protein (Sua5/YciO/YrdC/YwlC family)
MSYFYSIHPVNPQQRLLQKAVACIKTGGVVVFPTDSGYCIGCRVEDANAVKRIRAIRNLTSSHNMTLMLPDLSGLGHYVRIKTAYYRMIKTLLPGHYTFILPATREIPKLMAHPKRRHIGIRVPDNTIALSLLAALDAPLVTSTLILPGAEEPLSEAEAIEDILGKKVDLIIEGGELVYHPTTVIDLTEDDPKVVRRGAGQTALFE